MRRLPRKPNKRQQLIIEAVKDFFGKMNAEEKKSATKIALWLMNRKRWLEPLTENEIEDMKLIKSNIGDKTYQEALLKLHSEAL